jgi:hypothetical protein
VSIISTFPLTIDVYVYSTTRLAAGRGFSQDTPVSSTNKTDRHHINEILLKV